MAELKTQIQAKRYPSSDRRFSFVPEGVLESLFTVDKIRSALRHSKTQRDREYECIKSIQQGGKKTFAILVLIQRAHQIINFIENEQLQGSELDAKLPYSSKAALESILPKPDAEDFYEKQWEFTAPIFRRKTGHRCLDERTIFPFIETTSREGGGFGAIYQEKLHHSHSTADLWTQKRPDHTIVRKELKASHQDTTFEFQRECRVLSFLNCLEHPNIVELLGSYTLNGIHNLIFPVADHDLNALLQGQQPSDFSSEQDFLFALCGLASALEKLHTYSCEDLDVTLIGCHHDLKPDNILLLGTKLILADFGLSSFKPASEGSKTTCTPGDTRYLAPECEDWDNSFQPGEVGRKSDIWSFGCVLSEVITYMMLGPFEVNQFEQSQKVTLEKSDGRWTLCSFHAGTKLNKNVEVWLTTLDHTATTACKGMLNLVRQMLSIDPDDRPYADEVARCLRFWTIESIFTHVNVALSSRYRPYRRELDMLIEMERLHLWGQIVGLKGPYDKTVWHKNTFTVNNSFHQTFQNLKDIEEKVVLRSETGDDLHTKAIQLRMINDKLVHTLPEASQAALNSLLEQKLLNTDDLGFLELIKQTFDQGSQHRSIGTLAAVRYMNQLCEAPTKGHGRRMQLGEVFSKLQKSFHLFSIEEISAEGKHPTQALVEKIKYEEFWLNKLGEELFDRIGSVLELLRTASRSDKELRLPSPIGWSHDLPNHTFKLIFSIPNSGNASTNDPPRIQTLRQYIEASEKHRPALDDRFLLARRLTGTLSKLHKIKWVHKNISAFSIIFSLQLDDRPHQKIPLPYLIGFNYSRPSDPEWWSSLPQYDIAVTDYCHPEYSTQMTRVRYQPRFDWYSLGLVMLEIGLWRTLGSMTKKKETEGMSPHELLQHVQRKYVPLLDFYMGRGYREVVERCLVGDIGPETSDREGHDTDTEKFELVQTVEEQLANCSF
ncbi:uncharacterized protein KY384_001157 [Bacidia gigantensis]|uniref:uncharacterized protein n=1 Tax=Bacidia gigantensis TaxID=2732470 RepID=UPI001D0507CC|nr:uncharacterized protein KY384_001157 [Bacidia gigantensis]KAG8534313.1 hypothetical protein KY384_001157 [Bacidia gigantensis]